MPGYGRCGRSTINGSRASASMKRASSCCMAMSNVAANRRRNANSPALSATGRITSAATGLARHRRVRVSRFEQRLRARLENEEFAAGYREMAAELDLVRALDEAREQLHVSKEELAARTGRRRESVSRLFN